MTPLALERACLSAWPAPIVAQRFGWTFQAARGCSGRANCVWPLAWTGEAPLLGAITQAALWCRKHNIAPAFKLADGAAFPEGLEQALKDLGCSARHETLVMTRAIGGETSNGDADLIADADERVWAPLRESTPSPEDFAERQDIVSRISDAHAFALSQSDGKDAAIGLGVRRGELVGLYMMRTAPWARRRGLARGVVRALIAWGAAHGAAHAYLQVEEDNAGARALYEAEGFTLCYRYRYWKAP